MHGLETHNSDIKLTFPSSNVFEVSQMQILRNLACLVLSLARSRGKDVAPQKRCRCVLSDWRVDQDETADQRGRNHCQRLQGNKGMRKGFFIGSHRSMDQRNRSRQARNYRYIGKVSAEGLDCTLVLRKPDSGWETRWSRQNGEVTMRYFQRWLRWQKGFSLVTGATGYTLRRSCVGGSPQ